ncbi:DHA2 family efflux MFS transporter permease subunit [Paenibacillus validus]|uniref:DHA2 family efflux MFS transporter permease subunit n=1 Tax=Paenibacillus validus TaxID=44253 RepID=A0A7X2ZAX6_9BACL|nr:MULTISPECIES: DHA2 family efflux MFS transporter permease subunit [Paenibacillus]MED4603824.1 DHA2 family efflux MFS transporter permease subunit [Paenibacillus validus]MED4608820.1 DHA2 family efflux MFS transporter permease subunit [Paenibacillus validus]MUG71492.1 DHA2 family efflux MFS transporter permease subunit [Paenibacillus validus]
MSAQNEQENKGDKAPQAAAKLPGFAMVALILGVFMAILDTSIVNVAIPKMMSVFGVNQSQIEWVVTAYALVSGALVPATGFLGDRFGYKKMYVISLAIFTIGSGLCGIAWSNNAMIVFRIVQAVGGGAMMPISMAMILRMIPVERRGIAMGMFGIAIMFAPATGPTLSGYIVEYLDWRLIFTINVPIGILDLFLSAAFLREFKSEVKRRFDLAGFLTSSLGLASLLYGVGLVSEKGWTDHEVLAFVLTGLVSLIAFITIELHVKDPLLDLSLMKNWTFTLTVSISSLVTVIMMGVLFLLPIFLQSVSGLSAVQTGLLLLPQALMSGFMMPIAGALYDKIGAKAIAVIGMLITAYALYLTSQLSMETSHGTIVFWMCLRAAGMGLMMMPMQTAGMSTVPMDKVGQGTALSNTIRQVSGAFGIAWLSMLFTDRRNFHSASYAEQLNMFSTSVTDQINRLQNSFVALGQSASQARASALSYVAGQVQIEATITALDDVFILTAALSLVALALSLLIKEKKRKGEPGMPMMGE